MRGTWCAVLVSIGVAGCNGEGKDGTDDRVAAILALEGDVDAGATVFADNCAICHAADASGGSGPAIAGYDDAQTLVENVLYGTGTMSAFEDILSDQQVADVLAHVQSL